jgi:hypothetical protein
VLVAPPTVDPETIAKAREALRQKMNELEKQSTTAAQPLPAVAPPAPAPAPVVQSQPAAVQAAPAPAPAAQPASQPAIVAPTPASPETLAKAQAAMEQKMRELQALPSVAAGGAAAAPALQSGRPAKRNQTLQQFPPLKGPPPAVAADKEQRLQELLRKYKADQITPEQYHLQRAKILAEP